MDRIDRDELALPVRLYPLVHNGDTRKTIVIDPTVSFGQPFVREKGVTTEALVERINAGESIEDVLCDYNLQQEELDDVLVYAYPMAA